MCIPLCLAFFAQLLVSFMKLVYLFLLQYYNLMYEYMQFIYSVDGHWDEWCFQTPCAPVHAFLFSIYVEMEFLGMRIYKYSNLVHVKWFSQVVVPNYRLINSV